MEHATHEWDGYDEERRAVVYGGAEEPSYWSTVNGEWRKDQCGQDRNAAAEIARLSAETQRQAERIEMLERALREIQKMVIPSSEVSHRCWVALAPPSTPAEEEPEA